MKLLKKNNMISKINIYLPSDEERKILSYATKKIWIETDKNFVKQLTQINNFYKKEILYLIKETKKKNLIIKFKK